jgi:hypothetical protein
LKEPWQQSDEESASSSLKNGDPMHDSWVDAIVKMKQEMGVEAFNTFAIKLALEEEAGLRKRNPDHPLLKLLDAHRSREEKGFF